MFDRLKFIFKPGVRCWKVTKELVRGYLFRLGPDCDIDLRRGPQLSLRPKRTKSHQVVTAFLAVSICSVIT